MKTRNTQLDTLKRVRIQSQNKARAREIRMMNRFLRELNRAMKKIPAMPEATSIRSTLRTICVVTRANRTFTENRIK